MESRKIKRRKGLPEKIIRARQHLIIAIGKIGRRLKPIFMNEDPDKFHLVTVEYPETIRFWAPGLQSGICWNDMHFPGGIKSFETFCNNLGRPGGFKMFAQYMMHASGPFPENFRMMIMEANSISIVANLDNNLLSPYGLANVAKYIDGSRFLTIITHREMVQGDDILLENVQWALESISRDGNKIQVNSMFPPLDDAGNFSRDEAAGLEILNAIVTAIRKHAHASTAPDSIDRSREPQQSYGMNEEESQFEALPEPSGLMSIAESVPAELDYIGQLCTPEKHIIKAPSVLPELPAFDRFLPEFDDTDLIIMGFENMEWKQTQSKFLENIAMHYSMNLNKGVLYFALDNGVTMTWGLLSAIANVESNNMFFGWLDDEEWKRLLVAGERLSNSRMFSYSAPDITLSGLREAITQCISLLNGFPLGLIVIDYLELVRLSDDSNSMTRQHEISQVACELKRLARDLKVPMICSSQISWKPVDSSDRQPRPQLSELGEIGKSADIACFLHIDEYWKPPDKEKGMDYEKCMDYELIVAKNLHGTVGTTQLPDSFGPWGYKTQE
ncbi:MAG: DnaB-like helicase C-terminal domain-containing protein [Candidatus Riflebacteria bacterium]|nr:DnaB-like helicase C-terminal domain-containing protein [Candidatus Riflebacteria bacterium]